MAVPIVEEEQGNVVVHGKHIWSDGIKDSTEHFICEEKHVMPQGADEIKNIQMRERTKSSSCIVRFTILSCVLIVLKTWIKDENEKIIIDNEYEDGYKPRHRPKLKKKFPNNKKDWIHRFVKTFQFLPRPVIYQICMLYSQDYNKFIDERTKLNSQMKDSMQFEWSRLSTFANYPMTEMSVIRLAEAGFFYEGNGDEVTCYFCGLRHGHWNSKDNPKELHRKQSPNCSYVISMNVNDTSLAIHESLAIPETIGYGACGNQEDVENMHAMDRNKQSDERQNIPAKTNEYYSETNDTSISRNINQKSDEVNLPCPVPRTETITPARSLTSIPTNCTNASPDDTSNQLSFQSRPTEMFSSRNDTTGLIRVPRNYSAQVLLETPLTVSTPSSTSCSEATNMGVCIDKPKYPKYAIRTTRLTSFTNWPSYLTQTPENLAIAGFFYTGTEDHCRCFFCGGGLRRWEEDDFPWTEHARWYPTCPFVRQCKGESFIDAVQKGRNPELDELRQHEDQNKTTKDVNECTNNTAVKAMLEFGYDTDAVKTAYTSLKDSGIEDINVSLLLETLEAMVKNEQHPFTPDNNNMSSLEKQQRTNQNSTTQENTAKLDPLLELSIKSLEEENRNLKDQQTCKICLDEPVAIVFLPCGHMAACVNCSPALRRCPICRAFIKGTLKAIIC